MANITVKKYDNTTDQVYTAVQASAGDRSPAIWQNLSVGTAKAHRPELRVTARDNGPQTARRVETSFVWPQTATGTDGRINVVDRAVGNSVHVLPKAMTETEVREYAAQYAHLLASALIKQCVVDGFSAT
jgi:hypothetical protein